MVNKALVVLVGLFCLTQLSLSEPVHLKNLKRSRRDLLDDIKKSLDQLFSTVQEAYKNALWTITTQFSDLLTFAGEILKNSTSLIQEVKEQQIEGLKNLTGKAVELGIDISECVIENEVKLLDLYQLTLQELSKCFNGRMGEAETAIDKIFVDVSTTLDEVTEIGKEIDKCGINPLCLSGVTATITTDMILLPKRITDDENKAIQYVETGKIDLTKCSTVASDRITLEGWKFVTETTDCVQNKLGVGGGN